PPFTVRTCKQDALGRSKKQRFYAFIETSEGDLGELLVANGMARVHGTSATPVGLSSPEREKRKLERLEREAKQQKVGAWGASVGRMAARLSKQLARSGPDSFNAFFHPERVATPPADATPESPPPAMAIKPPAASAAPMPSASVGAKLNVNTATAAELMSVKGIGPVLAGRI
ncbi:MAG: thermonuclease family protein, partial [Chthoniobacterales bacterium]